MNTTLNHFHLGMGWKSHTEKFWYVKATTVPLPLHDPHRMPAETTHFDTEREARDFMVSSIAKAEGGAL